MRTEVKLLIDGVWEDGSARARPVVNPATGIEIGTVAAADADDIDRAAAAAWRGFIVWRRYPAAKRAHILRKAAGLMRQRADAIAEGLTQDQGKPIAQARIEVLSSAETFEWFAEEGRRSYGMVLPSRDESVQQTILREPIGPVLCLAPWNFPISLAARKVAPALAAGCSAILKAPEEAPSSPAAMVAALHDAGVPAGAIGLLTGTPSEISSQLIADHRIRKLSFTGSTKVGKQLAALAGAHMKAVTMELGGHAPALIASDADVPAAARTLAGLKFRNAGQVCTAPTRFLVHSQIYEAFLDAFCSAAAAMRVGDGMADGVEIGPLAHPGRMEAMVALIADAVERGGRVRLGGERIGTAGTFFAPTILCDVPPEARVMNEEPFGPIAIVKRIDNIDAGIAEANRLPYGLAAYAYTSSAELARHLSREIECGKLSINAPVPPFPETPLGGVKDSGLGVEGGPEGLSAYMTSKFVTFA